MGESISLDTTLINEQGESVQLREMFSDKPVILTLVYYKCPMLCTLELNALVESLRRMHLEPNKDF